MAYHYMQNNKRVGLTAVALVISAAAAIACSPIAPSVSKSSLYGPPEKAGGAVRPTSKPDALAQQEQSSARARIVKYETRVLGETSFYSLEFDHKHQKVVTISEGLAPERFEEIRATGNTEIQLESDVPRKIIVVFRVSDDAFLNAEDASSFDTNLEPLEGGKWALRVPKSVPKPLLEHVLRHLEAVTVVFDNQTAAEELGPR